MNSTISLNSLARPSFKRLLASTLLASLLGLSLGAEAVTVQTVTREFDALSRLRKETYPDGRWVAYRYDANGNRTALIESMPNGSNRTTGYRYDALNRLSSVTDAALKVTTFTYDARDNLVTVKDARGLTTTYTYNGFDDLIKLVSPDTGTTTYTPDAAGQNTKVVDARGKSLTYTHDAAGRVTQRAEGDQTATYTWDTASNGKGLLAQNKLVRSTYTAQESFTYDDLGRVLSKQQVVNVPSASLANYTRTLAYSYNTLGQLQGLTYPSGAVVAYSYNPQGQISSVTVNGQILLQNISWGPLNRLQGWTWANGLSHTRTYDNTGRLQSLKHGTLLQKTYSYDAAGRLVQNSDTITTRSQSYAYDALDRLTQTQRNNTTDQYAYDATGNRTQVNWGAAQTNATTSTTSNRLDSLSGSTNQSFTYDAAGNLLADGKYDHIYTNSGRLIALRLPGNTANAYAYYTNANGERIFKHGGTTNRRVFVYDDNAHLLGEYDASTGQYQEHLWLGDTPIANLRQPLVVGGAIQTYYVLADHLDTPKQLIDPTLDVATTKGRVLWRWEGEAFGNSPADEDADNNGTKLTYNLRFPGQYADTETNRFYNYYRDYDPALGRYIESDPIGLEGGINTYGYVEGNPTLFSDPLGLFRGGRKVWNKLQGTPSTKDVADNIDNITDIVKNFIWPSDDRSPQTCITATCTVVGEKQCSVFSTSSFTPEAPKPSELPANCTCTKTTLKKPGPAGNPPGY